MNGSLGGTQKRRGSSSRSTGVKWDETNLHENEIIKAAMQPLTKIREPKTPYHGPSSCDSDSDSAMQMDPLALDRESSQEAASSGRSTDQGEDELESQAAQHDSLADASPRELRAGSISTERQPSVGWSDLEAGVSEAGDETAEAEAHARFQQLRKKHYQLPKALLPHENGAAEEGDQAVITDPDRTEQRDDK